MARYLIEVIFERVTANEELRQHVTNIESHVITFENENQEAALDAAEAEFKRICTEGLYMQGGAVIKSLILPSAIKQLGLVDLDMFDRKSADPKPTPSSTPSHRPAFNV